MSQKIALLVIGSLRKFVGILPGSNGVRLQKIPGRRPTVPPWRQWTRKTGSAISAIRVKNHDYWKSSDRPDLFRVDWWDQFEIPEVGAGALGHYCRHHGAPGRPKMENFNLFLLSWKSFYSYFEQFWGLMNWVTGAPGRCCRHHGAPGRPKMEFFKKFQIFKFYPNYITYY